MFIRSRAIRIDYHVSQNHDPFELHSIN